MAAKAVPKKSTSKAKSATKGSRPATSPAKKAPPKSTPPAKARKKKPVPAVVIHEPPARSRRLPESDEHAPLGADFRRRHRVPPPSPPPAEQPPRLLPERKSTAAALTMLERAIKLVYQKDFKKAKQELKGLAEMHPAEKEILARARTYQQICEREETAHKRTPVTNDQLYSLGILEHNRGNFNAAITYFLQSLEKHQQADFIYYSLAASCARNGAADSALEYLRRAIQINESNRVYAKNDSDFEPLHGIREFTDLTGMNPPASSDSPA